MHPEGEFGVPSAELVTELVKNRVELARWLGGVLGAPGDAARWEEQPAAFLCRALLRWVWQKNQFFELDGEGERALEARYREWLERAQAILSRDAPDAEIGAELGELFRDHRVAVAELIRSQLGPAPRDVVSSEYSPDLVLAILGLSPESLVDPVLDVGCGRTATVVRLLRASGRDARGVDRDAPDDVATRSDWLRFDYGSERWGTVLSHLGFSLHFLHYHLKSDDRSLIYAHAFMRILRSLEVGGTFAYAPALPFIEALLPPDKYACESGALPEALRGDAIVRVERTTGLPLGTSTRIRRLS